MFCATFSIFQNLPFLDFIFSCFFQNLPFPNFYIFLFFWYCMLFSKFISRCKNVLKFAVADLLKISCDKNILKHILAFVNSADPYCGFNGSTPLTYFAFLIWPYKVTRFRDNYLDVSLVRSAPYFGM